MKTLELIEELTVADKKFYTLSKQRERRRGKGEKERERRVRSGKTKAKQGYKDTRKTREMREYLKFLFNANLYNSILLLPRRQCFPSTK